MTPEPVKLAVNPTITGIGISAECSAGLTPETSSEHHSQGECPKDKILSLLLKPEEKTSVLQQPARPSLVCTHEV